MRDHKIPEVGSYKSVVIIEVWGAIALFNGPVDMYQQDNGKSWLLFAISGVLGTYATIYASKWVEKGRIGWLCCLVQLGKIQSLYYLHTITYAE